MEGGEQEDPPLKGAEKSTWSVEQWDPSLWGACCVGSSCIITDAFNCRELGGYHLVGTLICEPEICQTGVCCTSTPECLDESDLGFPVEQQDCDEQGGVFVGGAPACDATDPCARYRIPEGFETVEVTPGFEPFKRRHPRMNNCGEIAVHIGTEEDSWEADVYVYDNGLLTQATDSLLGDTFPDINDHGTVTWARWNEDFSDGRIFTLRTGQETGIGEEGDVGAPAINELEHIAWKMHEPGPCAASDYKCDIFLFDGVVVTEIYDDGYSNQSVRINDSDQMAWTQFQFPCGGGDWTSDILLYSGAQAQSLPSQAVTPQLPDVDNLVRVAWGSFCLLEVWRDGQTVALADGHLPALNDCGDVVYSFKTDDTPWQLVLWRDGAFYQVTHAQDIESVIDNMRPAVNDAGEIAWWWKPNGQLAPSGTRLMRRIRNGDMDQDLDTDFDDFVIFSGCMTGPGEFDDLCECRFCDIEHDRDVDADDFSYFVRTYVGPEPDCNANTESDLYDIVNGTSFDCNVNGIPDDCDIDPTDPDGNGLISEDLNENGIPDECDCPIASAPTGDTYPPPGAFGGKNRYLSITAGDEGKQQAIQVTFTSLPGYEYAQGRTMWVQEPSLVPEPSGCSDLDVCPTSPFFQAARLGCEPYYADWSDLGTIDIYDGAIVPGATFEVRAITEGCDLGNPDKYSDPLTITMSRVGDVVGDCGVTPCTAPQGVVDFVDISALVEKFKNTPSAPRKARSDIIHSDVAQPLPDHKIDFVDISYCVDAFRSLASPLPGPPASDPCQWGDGPARVRRARRWP